MAIRCICCIACMGGHEGDEAVIEYFDDSIGVGIAADSSHEGWRG